MSSAQAPPQPCMARAPSLTQACFNVERKGTKDITAIELQTPCSRSGERQYSLPNLSGYPGANTQLLTTTVTALTTALTTAITNIMHPSPSRSESVFLCPGALLHTNGSTDWVLCRLGHSTPLNRHLRRFQTICRRTLRDLETDHQVRRLQGTMVRPESPSHSYD